MYLCNGHGNPARAEFSLIGFVTSAGSPLCGSHVVDVGEGSSPNEGDHFQRAPMGGHA